MTRIARVRDKNGPEQLVRELGLTERFRVDLHQDCRARIAPRVRLWCSPFCPLRVLQR